MVKPSLAEGLSKTTRIVVDKPRTIGFMGEACRVYATPELVRDIENTARDLLLQHLDSGEDSVGTRIAVDHLAATPEGMWVDVTVKVRELKGRAVTLEVECHDAVDKVASGEHKRFIVDLESVASRLKAKIAKSGAP